MSFATQKKKVFSREELFDLIYAIEERPGIWQTPAAYRIRKTLINEIGNKLKCTPSDIQKGWTILRTNYHKERSRIMDAKKKIGIECRSNWEYYEALHFLCKFSNNITQNLREMTTEEAEQAAEVKPRKTVSYDNSQQCELESNLTKLFSSKSGKFSPEIEQVLINNAIHSLRDANSRILKNSYSQNHVDKIVLDKNKKFADFVVKEIQDLTNEAQSKAKKEVKAILKKYSKLATNIEYSQPATNIEYSKPATNIEKDDKNGNQNYVCDCKVILNGSSSNVIEENLTTKHKDRHLKGILSNKGSNGKYGKNTGKNYEAIHDVNSVDLLEKGYNSVKDSNTRMSETCKKSNENIEKLNESVGIAEKPINGFDNADLILTSPRHKQNLEPKCKHKHQHRQHKQKLAPNTSSTSFYSILS